MEKAGDQDHAGHPRRGAEGPPHGRGRRGDGPTHPRHPSEQLPGRCDERQPTRSHGDHSHGGPDRQQHHQDRGHHGEPDHQGHPVVEHARQPHHADLPSARRPGVEQGLRADRSRQGVSRADRALGLPQHANPDHVLVGRARRQEAPQQGGELPRQLREATRSQGQDTGADRQDQRQAASEHGRPGERGARLRPVGTQEGRRLHPGPPRTRALRVVEGQQPQLPRPGRSEGTPADDRAAPGARHHRQASTGDRGRGFQVQGIRPEHRRPDRQREGDRRQAPGQAECRGASPHGRHRGRPERQPAQGQVDQEGQVQRPRPQPRSAVGQGGSERSCGVRAKQEVEPPQQGQEKAHRQPRPRTRRPRSEPQEAARSARPRGAQGMAQQRHRGQEGHQRRQRQHRHQGHHRHRPERQDQAEHHRRRSQGLRQPPRQQQGNDGLHPRRPAGQVEPEPRRRSGRRHR